MIHGSLKKGFSLIEIMIAVIIVGMMSMLVVPNVMKRFQKAKYSTLRTTIASLKDALTEYEVDMGHLPDKREGGLQALVKRPEGKVGESWKGPYLSSNELPLDPWKKELIYNKPAIKYKNKYKVYEIYSTGDENLGEEDTAPELHGGR